MGETEADGSFDLVNLDEGPMHLIVDSPEHLPTEVPAVAAGPLDTVQELVVHLEPGFAIEGRVEGVTAERLPIMRIVARRSDSENEKLDASVRAVANRPRIATCDANGRFRLGGLAAGTRYRLTAYETSEETGRISTRWPEIEPAYARVGDKDVVLSLKSPSTLVMRVVDDATGEPITRFEVRAGFDNLKALEVGGEPKREHPGGLARFTDLRKPADSGGARLQVRARGYERLDREDIELTEGEEVDLGELRLVRGPSLTVTVKDKATKKPIQDAMVFVGPSGWRENMLTRSIDPKPDFLERLEPRRFDFVVVALALRCDRDGELVLG